MLIIKGGRVLDPGNLDGIYDLVIEDGKIISITAGGASLPHRAKQNSSARVIDASGMVVTPGLIDIHVHLREPGHEYKETIESGCGAAVAGGFTAVCSMPNTNPVNDNAGVTKFILKKAKAAGLARVYPVGAVTTGLKGLELAEYGELKEAGVAALSDDGMPVNDSMMMRRAMEYAGSFGLPVISHCEELSLAGKGVMNEGSEATRLGLAGIPNAVESIMVMRDIALCELVGGRLHLAHVSTGESVAAIREAKKRGASVTAETAPHYFTLTDERVGDYDTNAKMNPPLRSGQDLEAIKAGLADGTIDAIVTDHAPHSPLEKQVEFDRAANGIVGLETSLPLSLALVREGVISLESLVMKMAKNPAEIIGIQRKIEKGAQADLTIIDLEKKFRIDSSCFVSKSRNTPFDGMEVTGAAVATIVRGRIVFMREGFGKP